MIYKLGMYGISDSQNTSTDLEKWCDVGFEVTRRIIYVYMLDVRRQQNSIRRSLDSIVHTKDIDMATCAQDNQY